MGKNFDIQPRKENNKVPHKIPNYPNIIPLELDDIKRHFGDAVKAINKQFALADSLVQDGKTAQAEHIWRAQIVFLVSALDYYMHCLTGYGICQIHDGKWDATEKYWKVNINIRFVEDAIFNHKEGWLLDSVAYYYKMKSMGSFHAIQEQLELLGIGINNVAAEMFPDDVKRDNPGDKFQNCREKLEEEIDDLYQHRNIIAHQSSRHYDTAEPKKIEKKYVEDSINNVQKMVEVIDRLANRK